MISCAIPAITTSLSSVKWYAYPLFSQYLAIARCIFAILGQTVISSQRIQKAFLNSLSIINTPSSNSGYRFRVERLLLMIHPLAQIRKATTQAVYLQNAKSRARVVEAVMIPLRKIAEPTSAMIIANIKIISVCMVTLHVLPMFSLIILQ